jgi:hypothetical protein
MFLKNKQKKRREAGGITVRPLLQLRSRDLRFVSFERTGGMQDRLFSARFRASSFVRPERSGRLASVHAWGTSKPANTVLMSARFKPCISA